MMDKWKRLFGPPAAGPLLHRVGEAAETGGYRVVIEEVLDPFLPTGGARPAEGLRPVAILVRVENHGSVEPLGYRASQWRIYDTEGFAFEPTSLEPWVRRPHLPEGFLNAATHVKGWISFALPEGSRVARGQFFIGYLSGKPVDFDLREESCD
jgi:hypothetical protein